MKKLIIILTSLTLIGTHGCTIERKSDAEYLHASVQKLTEVIVDNIYSPPAASRVYAYPSIAAYEALRPAHPEFLSMAGQLNGLDFTPEPGEKAEDIYFPLSALRAFLQVSKTMVHTEIGIDTFAQEVYREFEGSDMKRKVYDASLAYGDEVAAHILAWAEGDNYKQLRGRKHTLSGREGEWKPTGPAYMEAIEPYWNQIRPFVIDSATQFVPERPTAYDLSDTSAFYREMIEVYETKQNLREEEAAIAAFWDCNPYVMNVTGHVMYATKKITPGGHWIEITRLVTQEANLDLMETLEAYAITSVALADAFISCWDEKYRSNLIRPETVIQEEIDPTWQPLLQTPPFPEYTSGHSVISTAAAVALTDLLGDSFAFVDSTEVTYGLPPRSFDSFIQASEEAAISRLYGGIHYMPAIRNGQKQGRKVGRYINEKLETRKNSPAQASR